MALTTEQQKAFESAMPWGWQSPQMVIDTRNSNLNKLISGGTVLGDNTPPSSSPPVTQTPQQQSGGEDFMQYYAGWDPVAARGDFQGAFGGDINRLRAARGGSSLSGGGFDYSMYDPVFNAYKQQLASAEAELPLLLEESKQGSEAIRGDLEESLAQGRQQYATSAEEQRNVKESAFSEARRVYNALQQGFLSRYGTATSTGAAGSEIVAQQTQKDVGDINKIYLSNLGTLQSQLFNIEKYVSRKTDEETKRFQLEQQKIRKAVVDTKIEINNRMIDLNSQIGQQKQQDIRTLQGQLTQLGLDWAENIASIKVAAAEETGNIQEAIKALNDQYRQAQSILQQQTPYSPTLKTFDYNNSQPVYGRSDKREDEYSGVINPF